MAIHLEKSLTNGEATSADSQLETSSAEQAVLQVLLHFLNADRHVQTEQRMIPKATGDKLNVQVGKTKPAEFISFFCQVVGKAYTGGLNKEIPGIDIIKVRQRLTIMVMLAHARVRTIEGGDSVENVLAQMERTLVDEKQNMISISPNTQKNERLLYTTLASVIGTIQQDENLKQKLVEYVQVEKKEAIQVATA